LPRNNSGWPEKSGGSRGISFVVVSSPFPTVPAIAHHQAQYLILPSY